MCYNFYVRFLEAAPKNVKETNMFYGGKKEIYYVEKITFSLVGDAYYSDGACLL